MQAHMLVRLYEQRDQTHMKSFLRGLPEGLEQSFHEAFQDGENAVAYLKLLEEEGHRELNPNLVNGMPYFAFGDGHTEDALAIIDYASERFPDDSNLHDSRGEFLVALDRKEEAGAAITRALELLEAERSKLKPDDYAGKQEMYTEHLEELE